MYLFFLPFCFFFYGLGIPGSSKTCEQPEPAQPANLPVYHLRRLIIGRIGSRRKLPHPAMDTTTTTIMIIAVKTTCCSTPYVFFLLPPLLSLSLSVSLSFIPRRVQLSVLRAWHGSRADKTKFDLQGIQGRSTRSIASGRARPTTMYQAVPMVMYII